MFNYVACSAKIVGSSTSNMTVLVLPLSHAWSQAALKNSDRERRTSLVRKDLALPSPTMTFAGVFAKLALFLSY